MMVYPEVILRVGLVGTTPLRDHETQAFTATWESTADLIFGSMGLIESNVAGTSSAGGVANGHHPFSITLINIEG